MVLIIQVVAVVITMNLIFFLFVWQRLNAQDKYLSNSLQSFADYKGIPRPPQFDSTEITEEKVPEHYSPRHDYETKMQGKVIDFYD